MRTVIISGKQGSGKTTLQKALAKAWIDGEFGNVSAINFATPLYALHDTVLEQVSTWNLPYPIPLKKDGKLLQVLGDWGRSIATEFWITKLKRDIEDIRAGFGSTLIIIGDCRFRNELDAFPDAVKVRLEAPESVRRERTFGWREDTEHVSETDLDAYASEPGHFDVTYSTEALRTEEITTHLIKLIRTGVKDERRIW